tara:strand:- start:25055 stop:25858 length:804 start_codon:yes stop_codon:yes gene_type:complete
MHLAKSALIAATALAFAGSTAVSAQTSTQSAAPAAAEQTAEPNITGVWEIWPDPFAGEENTFLELPVPGGGPKLREPYATEWKALRDERDAMLRAGTPKVDPSTQCLPEGMPMIMGAIFPIEILQTPGQVTVLAEFLTQTRRIYLDKPMPPIEELNPNFYGYSVGHWEGDTLVVTTKGVKEDTEFFEIPHSVNMTITERIRLTGPDLLEDEITIDDPERLLEPYTFTYGYRRNPDYVIQEYFCEAVDPLLKFNEDGTVEMRTGDDIQ